MQDAMNEIRWEPHDEGDEGAFQSDCGRFEITMDAVHGYYRLHHAGDATESLAEARSIADLTAAAHILGSPAS